MYTYRMCIYRHNVYIYIYIHTYIDLSLSLYIYIYIHTCTSSLSSVLALQQRSHHVPHHGAAGAGAERELRVLLPAYSCNIMYYNMISYCTIIYNNQYYNMYYNIS